MKIRVGVIGVGYLGQHHARIYRELDAAELVGVSDADSRRAEEVAQKYGCRPFPHYRELLGICDAVSIATPTTTHHAIAMDCLREGKDVLVEKPITEDPDEAVAIVNLAHEKNLILQVGHLEQYNPGLIAAADLITTPVFIESERLSPFLGRGTDVDVTLDLMIHDVEIVLSLVQSGIKDIKAIGEPVLTEKIDVAKAWLEFENGCNALITASRLSPDKQRRLKVFQKESFISIDYQTQEVRRYHKKGQEVAIEVIKPETREPLKEELKDFLYYVKDRKKPRVSGIEALEALKVVHLITDRLKRPR